MTPQIRHAELKAEADILIGHLRDCLENHGSDERIDYGHVGDLSHVAQKLEELVMYLHGPMDKE